ncbi:MAG: tRNA (5-methylaminomethyl-2-thiouridine)(34)-methyltransferase MnmD [Pseudomonadota bacterium]
MERDPDQDSSAPRLDWTGGVPIARRFSDPYYSLQDGLAETRHVFLQGNDLPARWTGAREAYVAELGFGTGLNFLAALQLWRQVSAGGRLHFTSFERYPLAPDQMQRALAPWAELDSTGLLALWPMEGPQDMGDAVLEVVIGDARDTLPAWRGQADAWFLDGFAPARNADMWGLDLMQAVFNHTRPGGTFATYTAAGHVRRALSAAGFAVERRAGHAGKRHMSIGVRPET